MTSPLVTQPVVSVARTKRWTRWAVITDRKWFLIVWLLALVIFTANDFGRMVTDTKLGVDINAAGFYVRLWSLWNPLEWLGTLQDQYIGYAIPMGPFFLVFQLAHLPVWLIERLWFSLLVVTAFAGLFKLAEALRVGSPASRLLGGAVFALWPTFTIIIGSTSAATLPGVMLPWALLPLVTSVQRRTSAIRAAARSGVAIMLMGGVNAASTLAVLIMPAFYILFSTTGWRRIRLALCWTIAVVAATSWWLVPLLLQGRYSFNFLPYIEQATTTTRTMSAATMLRGTGNWTAYFDLGGPPWLPAGWAMVTSATPIIASTVTAAVGLYGLARRDLPVRPWLLASSGVVALIMLGGYYGPLGGPFHGLVDQFLNGTLAPFRNIYKFEPVMAVALALGCAHVMAIVLEKSFIVGTSVRVIVTGAALSAPLIALVLAGLAFPELTGQGLAQGSFSRIPGYWYRTARFLAQRSPRQTAVLVPASAHAQYVWGSAMDEPLEPLATSPWTERGLVPYGGAGSQELLSTIERAVESGQQVPGLPEYLARAGIRYVVVRNDLNPAIAGYTSPQAVNETMALSGFRRVAAFGPMMPGVPSYPAVTRLVPGFAVSYPAVEIFQANDRTLRPSGPVSDLPVGSTVLVNGGVDSLLQLAAQGIVTNQPTVIAGDQRGGRPALWAVTDGQRRTDNLFGSTDNNVSFTYTAGETNPSADPQGGSGQPPSQLLPVPAAGHQTVAVLSGAARVTASSYGAWYDLQPQYDPVNAFDGNPRTAWVEGDPSTPVGQWIQVDFTHPIDVPAQIGIQLLDDTPLRSVATRLEVTTATGSATSATVPTGTVQPLTVKPGWTRWLRVTILGASNVVAGNPGAGIRDVLIPGVRVTRYLQPSEDRSGITAPAVAYSFQQQVSSPYTQPGPATRQPMAREFSTPTAQSLKFRASAVPNNDASGVYSLISHVASAGRSAYRITATSTWDGMPEFSPANLIAQGRSRPWIAGAKDQAPALRVSWQGNRVISKIILRPAYGVAAVPTTVRIASRVGMRVVRIGHGGVATITPPLRTDEISLRFPTLSDTTGNRAAGQPARLPVGLAKLRIPALRGLRPVNTATSARFTLGCGKGPPVIVDGHRYLTSVSGTLGDLTEVRPVRLRLCARGDRLTLSAGRHRLLALSSADFTVTSLSLRGQSGTAAAVVASPGSRSRQLRVVNWQSDNRLLHIGPGTRSYVEIHENFNRGWVATMDGHRLTAVTLDGWQQAFIVPAGRGGTITLSFAPATVYHIGIFASALAILGLLAVATGVGRPPRGRVDPPGDFADVASQVGGHEVPWPSDKHADGANLALHAAIRDCAAVFALAALIFVAGGAVAAAVPILAIIGSLRPRVLPRIALAAMLAAGIAAVATAHRATLGYGVFGGFAQACALIGLAAALMPAIAIGRRVRQERPGSRPVTDGLRALFDKMRQNIELQKGDERLGH